MPSVDSGNNESIKKNDIDENSLECESGVSDEIINDTLQVQEFKERDSWHKATNLRVVFGELVAYNALTYVNNTFIVT